MAVMTTAAPSPAGTATVGRAVTVATASKAPTVATAAMVEGRDGDGSNGIGKNGDGSKGNSKATDNGHRGWQWQQQRAMGDGLGDGNAGAAMAEAMAIAMVAVEKVTWWEEGKMKTDFFILIFLCWGSSGMAVTAGMVW